MQRLAAQVGQALKSHGLMLCTAESCTGGGVSQAITEIAGSSAWFERGYVTYSNLSKQQSLDVSAVTLLQYGAVSEATVREMVSGALAHSDAQIALAVSGIAGPDGGSAEKPVGTVWFAWGIEQSECVARAYHLIGDRTSIREQAVKIALEGVLALLSSRTVSA